MSFGQYLDPTISAQQIYNITRHSIEPRNLAALSRTSLRLRLSPTANVISVPQSGVQASHFKIICKSSSSIMANIPKDGFPVFQDGDVEIRLSRKPEDRLVLHSVVLGLHSSFFKVSISERWSGRNDDAYSGDPIKWRYQLLFQEEVNDEEVPLLTKAVCRYNCQSQTLRLMIQTRNPK